MHAFASELDTYQIGFKTTILSTSASELPIGTTSSLPLVAHFLEGDRAGVRAQVYDFYSGSAQFSTTNLQRGTFPLVRIAEGDVQNVRILLSSASSDGASVIVTAQLTWRPLDASVSRLWTQDRLRFLDDTITTTFKLTYIDDYKDLYVVALENSAVGTSFFTPYLPPYPFPSSFRAPLTIYTYMYIWLRWFPFKRTDGDVVIELSLTVSSGSAYITDLNSASAPRPLSIFFLVEDDDVGYTAVGQNATPTGQMKLTFGESCLLPVSLSAQPTEPLGLEFSSFASYGNGDIINNLNDWENDSGFTFPVVPSFTPDYWTETQLLNLTSNTDFWLGVGTSSSLLCKPKSFM